MSRHVKPYAIPDAAPKGADPLYVRRKGMHAYCEWGTRTVIYGAMLHERDSDGAGDYRYLTAYGEETYIPSEYSPYMLQTRDY